MFAENGHLKIQFYGPSDIYDRAKYTNGWCDTGSSYQCNIGFGDGYGKGNGSLDGDGLGKGDTYWDGDGWSKHLNEHE
jgi:hypothetical protein